MAVVGGWTGAVGDGGGRAGVTRELRGIFGAGGVRECQASDNWGLGREAGRRDFRTQNIQQNWPILRNNGLKILRRRHRRSTRGVPPRSGPAWGG